jgi:phosphoribosylglycinamide formyltransferase-1
MYGMKVHEAVINNQEIQSGITIHFVNEAFDEGEIIFQATCPVLPGDSPEQLADRIHKLEYKYYPEIIRQVLAGTKK